MARSSWFLKVANALSRFAGRATTFVGAVGLVLLWAVQQSNAEFIITSRL